MGADLCRGGRFKALGVAAAILCVAHGPLRPVTLLRREVQTATHHLLHSTTTLLLTLKLETRHSESVAGEEKIQDDKLQRWNVEMRGGISYLLSPLDVGSWTQASDDHPFRGFGCWHEARGLRPKDGNFFTNRTSSGASALFPWGVAIVARARRRPGSSPPLAPGRHALAIKVPRLILILQEPSRRKPGRRLQPTSGGSSNFVLILHMASRKHVATRVGQENHASCRRYGSIRNFMQMTRQHAADSRYICSGAASCTKQSLS